MFEKLKIALFVLLLAGVFTACSDDDTPAPAPVVPDVEVEEPETDEPTAEELAEMAAVDKFAAANSVIRALALIGELPDNWESMTFAPEVGMPKDEANTDIRHIISSGVEAAEEYFLSIVPEAGLNGHTWSHEGVGTLTFRALNEKDCYAVVDANLVQMPGLKQLRFVPEAVVGDNGYKGVGFYRVGDIVQDANDVYWSCVRPSGGPHKKGKCHFVTFDPSAISTKKVSQKIYMLDSNGKPDKKQIVEAVSGDWIYAKNLAEERIAIAAAHVFAMLFGTESGYYDSYAHKRKYLKSLNLDMINFLANAKEGTNKFLVAYGSYISNKYSKYRQDKYLQPIFTLSHRMHEGKIEEMVTMIDYATHGTGKVERQLMSLTTDYDPMAYKSLTEKYNNWGKLPGYGIADRRFDIRNYVTHYDPEAKFTIPTNYPYWMNQDHNYYTLVMTQMSVEDHGEFNPDLYLVNEHLPEGQEPDYWGTLASNNIERYLLKENGKATLVKDLMK